MYMLYIYIYVHVYIYIYYIYAHMYICKIIIVIIIMIIYIYILLIWHDDPKCAPIIWAAHGLADDMAHCYSCLHDTYSGWLANCWLQPAIKTILISAEAEDASSSFPKAVGGNGKLRSCEWKPQKTKTVWMLYIYTGMNRFGKSLFVDMFRGLTLIEFH